MIIKLERVSDSYKKKQAGPRKQQRENIQKNASRSKVCPIGLQLQIYFMKNSFIRQLVLKNQECLQVRHLQEYQIVIYKEKTVVNSEEFCYHMLKHFFSQDSIQLKFQLKVKRQTPAPLEQHSAIIPFENFQDYYEGKSSIQAVVSTTETATGLPQTVLKEIDNYQVFASNLWPSLLTPLFLEKISKIRSMFNKVLEMNQAFYGYPSILVGLSVPQICFYDHQSYSYLHYEEGYLPLVDLNLGPGETRWLIIDEGVAMKNQKIRRLLLKDKKIVLSEAFLEKHQIQHKIVRQEPGTLLIMCSRVLFQNISQQQSTHLSWNAWPDSKPIHKGVIDYLMLKGCKNSKLPFKDMLLFILSMDRVKQQASALRMDCYLTHLIQFEYLDYQQISRTTSDLRQIYPYNKIRSKQSQHNCSQCGREILLYYYQCQGDEHSSNFCSQCLEKAKNKPAIINAISRQNDAIDKHINRIVEKLKSRKWETIKIEEEDPKSSDKESKSSSIHRSKADAPETAPIKKEESSSSSSSSSRTSSRSSSSNSYTSEKEDEKGSVGLKQASTSERVQGPGRAGTSNGAYRKRGLCLRASCLSDQFILFIQNFVNMVKRPTKKQIIKRQDLMYIFANYIAEYQERYKQQVKILHTKHANQVMSQKMAGFLKKRGLKELNSFKKNERQENWYGAFLNSEVDQIINQIKMKTTEMAPPDVINRRTDQKFQVD